MNRVRPASWIALGGGRRIWAVVALGACLLVSGAAPADENVTSEQVTKAVQRGLANLRQTQGADGIWGMKVDFMAQGITALNTLAMINAGVPTNDPAVAKALAAIARFPNERTYVVALKCQVLGAADPRAYAKTIQDSANWLTEAQLPSGMWTYFSARAGRGDNSNTQFALLGLHEAANAGAIVKPEVWQRSRKHFESTQMRDGGWTYVFDENVVADRRRPTGSYGSMTAAGVASLFICGQTLNVGGPKVFRNGAYPSCGLYKQNAAIASGMAWLSDNFTVNTNPGRNTWHFYYLYALERVGMLSGMRMIGPNDWYREGAAYLVDVQAGDGHWGGENGDTAFALLYLAKGNRPVLVQKVQWAGQWNRNIHDLENLTTFIGDKLGKLTTWQSTSLDLPLTQLRVSPILLITGHEFPRFTAEQKQRLADYVQTGGTLLFEACCGSKDFRDGFKAFAAEVWPDYRLRPLPADHPVFASVYKLEDTYGLEGIDVGCRTGVLYSPNALSCLWELRTVAESDKAFKLGTNIAAYATGREPLADKLSVVELPPVAEAAREPTEVPRGAVRIARLMHEGDYNADARALVNLTAMLRDKAHINVVSQGRQLAASDEKLYEYPVVFMTGHYSFKLSDKDVESLRLYLRHGGTLVAEACCGQKAFDVSFREMAARLFPDSPLTALPEDHPIYAGKIGLPLGELRYRKTLAEELHSGGTQRPALEAVVLDGRTAIIYSKYDYSCGLEGDNSGSCRGYVEADARRLAFDIFLYAISY